MSAKPATRKPFTEAGLKAKEYRQPGRYADKGCRGLYLLVKSEDRRQWVFRYRDRVTGKLRDKGLGLYPTVTLKQAHEAAAELRRTLQAGIDPIDAQRAARDAERLERSRLQTFGQCCDAYIAAHKAGWKNAKHRDQWRNTLDTYAADLLPLPVQAIDTALVVKALEAIWTDKTETATRVRQRIEAVLDWATVRKFRDGENPARWRGQLDKLLPKPSKLKNVQHHPALPYAALPEFYAALAERTTLAALALRFQILTATRPGEAVAAHWSEIDLAGKVWTIPAARMKARREHRIPLSPEAVALLESMPIRTGYVFPGKPGRALTIAATLRLLKSMRPDLTAHGFRSTFRDWAADQTAYPRDVAEAALAHTIKDATEAAYRRTDLLERRARMMADWSKYCATPGKPEAKVTPIRKRKAG